MSKAKKTYACPICGEEFAVQNDLVDHISDVHPAPTKAERAAAATSRGAPLGPPSRPAKPTVTAAEGDFRAWAEAEKARLEAERSAAMEERGYAQFWRVPQGSTRFTLLPVVPRDITGNFGPQKVFKATVGAEEVDWAVNQRSPVYRELVAELVNAPVELSVTRIGSGPATRMEIVR